MMILFSLEHDAKVSSFFELSNLFNRKFRKKNFFLI